MKRTRQSEKLKKDLLKTQVRSLGRNDIDVYTMRDLRDPTVLASDGAEIMKYTVMFATSAGRALVGDSWLTRYVWHTGTVHDSMQSARAETRGFTPCAQTLMFAVRPYDTRFDGLPDFLAR